MDTRNVDVYCMMCGKQLDPNRPKEGPRAICPKCEELKSHGERLCPVCRETIKMEAAKCRFCGETLTGGTAAGGTRTSAMAVTSLALGIIGCFYCIPGIAGIVLGIIARKQIRDSGGSLTGSKMAAWGIGVGAAWIFFYFLLFIITALNH